MSSKLSILALSVAMSSSYTDPCAKGYTQQTAADGATYCLLDDDDDGIIYNFELGDTYQYKAHGIITNKKGFGGITIIKL